MALFPPFTIESLPSLEERKIRLLEHLYDYYMPPSEARSYFLLRTPNNTFPLSNGNGAVTVYPCVEEELNTSYRDIVRFLMRQVSWVNIVVENPTERTLRAMGEEGIAFQHGEIVTRYYQTLLPPEQYQRALRRFKNTDYTHRVLSKKNIPSLIELVRSWSEKKLSESRDHFMYAALRFDNAACDRSIVDLPLSDLQTSIGSVSLFHSQMAISAEEWVDTIDLPTTKIYGCFSNGNLVAITHTLGNDTLRVIECRASQRISPSAQEYLDLHIYNEFALSGVQKVSRGWKVPRNHESLLQYKRKFGPIEEVTTQKLLNCAPVRSRFEGVVDAYLDRRTSR